MKVARARRRYQGRMFCQLYIDIATGVVEGNGKSLNLTLPLILYPILFFHLIFQFNSRKIITLFHILKQICLLVDHLMS